MALRPEAAKQLYCDMSQLFSYMEPGPAVLVATSAYDEVWVLPYIPVHKEGQTQLIDSFTEI